MALGPLQAAGVYAPQPVTGAPGRPAQAGAPSPLAEAPPDQAHLSPEAHEGQGAPLGQMPNFGAWAHEESPYRQGQDAQTAQAGRDKDQQLLDHVCGEGCKCGRSASGGGGEDPLKAMEARDTEVRQHEQEHLKEAGEFAKSGPLLDTVTASNGRPYAMGGHVDVDTGEEGDAQKTYAKMEKIERAALKPAEPSDQDRKVAKEASTKKDKAMRDLRQRGQDSPRPA